MSSIVIVILSSMARHRGVAMVRVKWKMCCRSQGTMRRLWFGQWSIKRSRKKKTELSVALHQTWPETTRDLQSVVHNSMQQNVTLQYITQLQTNCKQWRTVLMEKEFYHFECLKSLRNIPELQLQKYCNILKKQKEEFVVHRLMDFHSYDSSFNLFSNLCRLIYGTTLIPGDVYIPQQNLYVL